MNMERNQNLSLNPIINNEDSSTNNLKNSSLKGEMEESRLKEFENISKIINLDQNLPDDMFLMQKGDTTLLSAFEDKKDEFLNSIFHNKLDIKLEFHDIIQANWSHFSKYTYY